MMTFCIYFTLVAIGVVIGLIVGGLVCPWRRRFMAATADMEKALEWLHPLSGSRVVIARSILQSHVMAAKGEVYIT